MKNMLTKKIIIIKKIINKNIQKRIVLELQYLREVLRFLPIYPN